MTSSGLVARKKKIGPPPQCHKTPEGFRYVTPPAAGSTLQAIARWTDLDPSAPSDRTELITLTRIGPGDVFKGRTPPAGYGLELTCERQGTSDYWKVSLQIYHAYPPEGPFVWTDVYVNPDEPFTTRLLHDIFRPGIDFRFTRITT